MSLSPSYVFLYYLIYLFIFPNKLMKSGRREAAPYLFEGSGTREANELIPSRLFSQVDETYIGMNQSWYRKQNG